MRARDFPCCLSGWLILLGMEDAIALSDRVMNAVALMEGLKAQWATKFHHVALVV